MPTEVLSLLLKTKELLGVTIIMVTHDLSIAAHADRVCVMENGILEPLVGYKKGQRSSGSAGKAGDRNNYNDRKINIRDFPGHMYRFTLNVK